MRMQPRQEILDIWRALVRWSWQKDQWVWGGRFDSNSIGDAEQLLCLLLPASKVHVFGLDDPDRTGIDSLDALEDFGGTMEIPRRIVTVLQDYYVRYTDESTAGEETAATPIFAGGSYFNEALDGSEPTEEQRQLDIVDSYAMAITLSLAVIGFVRVFRSKTRRQAIRDQIDDVERRASARLTAAMVGLLRSFSVNVFDADSEYGRNLVRTVNQEGLPSREVVDGLRLELRQTMASFREVLIGSGQVTDLDSQNQLFECGWSWGIVEDAPNIEVAPTEAIGVQRKGIAEQAPYLYFTVIALDAIEDLFSERTRVLGLLNEEQQRLSRALQLRSDLTRSYWATVATYGEGTRWPLEDIPWRTTDGLDSDYFTLQVTSLAVKGLVQDRSSNDELVRIGNVLSELANRARMTRRPNRNDPALTLHHPGVQLSLVGSERAGDSEITWIVNEFAPLLLQRTANIAGLLSDAADRGALLETADRVWEHLLQRRLQRGPGRNLWDDPSGAFTELEGRVPPQNAPSWLISERVVAALVATATVLDRRPLTSPALGEHADALLSEAEQLFDRELMRGTGKSLESDIKSIRANLRRAREIISDRPGTAAHLALSVLGLLNDLSAGRQKSTGVN
ncbi:SCO2524 family protein [Dactylosporangium sp. McL0621]|uniref:SCO2524 family protein n=1 Tax=Dactylosporangium sp. McL0621 TaxID=3415678 RepID=UPI003CF7EF2E